MFNFYLEAKIDNFLFIILFLIMIFYWFQAIFPIIPKFHLIIILLTMCANLNLIFLLIIRWLTCKQFPLSNLYESLLFLSWSFTLIQLFFLYAIHVNVKRKWNGSRIVYQVINFLPFIGKNPLGATVVNTSSFFPFRFSYALSSKKISIIVGTILSPMAFFTNSFATFSLPKNMQKAHALVPALQSNWLIMHVTVMMVSYTALLFGSLLAISFLIIDKIAKKPAREAHSRRKNSKAIFPTQKSIQISTNTKHKMTATGISHSIVKVPETKIVFANFNAMTNTAAPNYCNSILFLKNDKLFIENKITNSNSNQKPIISLAKTLDNLSYRILGIGFPLLTVGILSGAVWANEAWGSYWSWDPKETWAFITWLVFAIYFHARIIKGWEGQKPAILASLGFFTVWICYLGVNILGTGLHSYGWLKQL